MKSASGSRLMANVYLSNGIVGTVAPNLLGYELVKNLSVETFCQNAGQMERRYTHYLPIRFGATLSFRLNDRWSLESGLVYSRLSSDCLLFGTRGFISKIEQRLNYLGIPLKVNFHLKENRHFAAYLSAGGTVEKMVKGSLLETTTKETRSARIRPLQFSVNGAFGLEYKLINLLSIYAEPGVGYYFDNGSTLSTFYQDKPFSFNLNLGLRFNLK
jgi:hypothetical protein